MKGGFKVLVHNLCFKFCSILVVNAELIHHYLFPIVEKMQIIELNVQDIDYYLFILSDFRIVSDINVP